MEPGGPEISNMAEPPHFIAQAKIDDKGRFKLPADSWEWCKKSNVVNVFVTTFDKKTVRIYPIPLWKSTVIVLEGPGEQADAFEAILKVARYYGRDAEIDAQGRIVIHGELRTALTLGSEPVCVEHLKGRIDFSKKSVHDGLLQAAETNLEEKNAIVRKLGL
jgi:DNA-binding transcriptional regulator/RsmH inhibitor MraZ